MNSLPSPAYRAHAEREESHAEAFERHRDRILRSPVDFAECVLYPLTEDGNEYVRAVMALARNPHAGIEVPPLLKLLNDQLDRAAERGAGEDNMGEIE